MSLPLLRLLAQKLFDHQLLVRAVVVKPVKLLDAAPVNLSATRLIFQAVNKHLRSLHVIAAQECHVLAHGRCHLIY